MDATGFVRDSALAFNDVAHADRVQPELLERMLDSASFAAQMLESAATQSPQTASRAGEDDSGAPDQKRQASCA